MLKKITFITLAAMMAIGFIHSNSYAESAGDLENIQEKRENIENDLSEAEEHSRSLVSEINDLNQEVEQGNAILEEKQALMEETERDIADTIGDIHSLQDEIKELETDIDKRYDLLKDRLASYQKSGGMVGYLEVIFGAESFGDFISRVSMVTKITDSDAALMEQFEEETEKAEAKQSLAMEKLDELNNVKQEQESAVASIHETKQKNETRIETLGEKQQELTQLAGKLQNEDSDLATLEKKTEQRIAAAAEAERKAEEEAKRKEQKRKQHEKVVGEQEAENAGAESGETKADTDTNANGKTFTVTTTAYTIESAGGSGFTATGIDLNKNPDTKVIAVDPDVIPLGSIVHVEGYGYAIAGDTGGAINGKKIDVFVSTQEEATKWGVRTVRVTIQ